MLAIFNLQIEQYSINMNIFTYIQYEVDSK